MSLQFSQCILGISGNDCIKNKEIRKLAGFEETGDIEKERRRFRRPLCVSDYRSVYIVTGFESNDSGKKERIFARDGLGLGIEVVQ